MKEGELIDLTEFKFDFQIVDADGPPKSYDDSGQSYITLVAGGIKTEGSDFPFICPTEREAIKRYFKSLEEFLQARKIIIWRTRPELVVFTFKGKKHAWDRHYQVYSRLTVY
jgi:hypothetical protein